MAAKEGKVASAPVLTHKSAVESFPSKNREDVFSAPGTNEPMNDLESD